jgi:hypothetical protein
MHIEGSAMSQVEGLEVLTQLTQFDASLQNDSGGQLVLALLKDLDSTVLATRALLTQLDQASRATLVCLVGGFEAAQRVLRELWENTHGSLQKAWSYSLPVSFQEPLMGSESDYPPLYQTLMMVALLAHMYECDEAELQLLDAAVEATVPMPVIYRVNCTLAMGLKGNAEKAKEQLQQRIDTNPSDELAKITMGAALALAGDAQWRNSLDYVVATSDDMPLRAMAMTMIEMAESSGLR